MPTDPSPIAYAIPANERTDDRARRVLAHAAIGYAAYMLAAGCFGLAMRLGVVPSRIVPTMAAAPVQMMVTALTIACHAITLIGGAMLLRHDGEVPRLFLRVGCGAIVTAYLIVQAVGIATIGPTWSLADRAYIFLANLASQLVGPAMTFVLTFALSRRIVWPASGV